MKIDKTKIPEGDYCYTYDKNEYFVRCPYWKVREFNGVEIPWCNYLDCGGIIGNDTRRTLQGS